MMPLELINGSFYRNGQKILPTGALSVLVQEFLNMRPAVG